MAGRDLVSEAAAELYTNDPAGFIPRRAELAAGARTVGDVPAAKAIAALRKPTRAAWMLNRLVRTEPGVPARLAALAADLRSAGRSLDGDRIRELSRARRELIAELTRQALAEAGQRSAPTGLQEEVSATLSAAVTDPEVGDELAAGTLVRAVERAAFGFGLTPTEAGLAAVPDVKPPPPSPPLPPGPRAARRPRPTKAEADRARAERVQAQQAEAEQAAAGRERARAEREQAKAERQRRRRELAAAEQAVRAADQAVEDAQIAEQKRAGAVSRAERQLAEERRRLGEAKLRTREAARAQRDANQALDRIRKLPPPGPLGLA